jgi:predicted DNA-binding transcriptional regulator YafY
MIILKQIELLRKAHELISQECTGTPEEFASRLRVSQRRFYDIINEMKDMGAPIDYSRMGKTYFYTEKCEVKLNCSFRVLTDSEKNDTFAGSFLKKNSNCFFYAVNELNFALSNGGF